MLGWYLHTSTGRIRVGGVDVISNSLTIFFFFLSTQKVLKVTI